MDMNVNWFAVTLVYERDDGSLHEWVHAGRGTPVEIQREAMIRMMEFLQGVMHRWVDCRGVPTTEWGARELMRLAHPGKFAPGITIAR